MIRPTLLIQNLFMERSKAMAAKFIIGVLTILFGLSQVSCAEKADEVTVLEKKVEDAHKENAEMNEKVGKLVDQLDKDIEDEISEIVKEAIEQPTEYDIPQDVLAVMQSCQTSWNVWRDRIADTQKTIALENAKIAIAKANQRTDSQTIVHSMRTYLAGQGVQDLGNWKMAGTKAVLKNPPEKKE